MNRYIWDVTHFCPLQCAYCYTDSGPWRENTNPAELMKVAAAIVREKGRYVVFGGGEPTLAKGIIEVTEYLRANGVRMGMVTSGWGFDEARAKRYLDLVEHFNVSIDAVDPELNDRIRGKVGAHRNAVRALEALSRLHREHGRPQFAVDCTVVRANFSQIAEFCQFIAAAFEGLSAINIAPAIPGGRASKLPYCDTELLTRGQVDALLEQSQALRDALPASIRLSVKNNDFLKEDIGVVELSPAGDVKMLSYCGAILGNLVDDSLATILERGSAWRNDSALARSLKQAPDFVAWGDIVRRLDAVSRSA